jgi:hypothetical protein
MRFNERAAQNLAHIIDQTRASIVLTSTHRINYPIDEWLRILKTRGINPTSISKINSVETVDRMADRATEIEEWISSCWNGEAYVIIDDGLSINRLSQPIKNHCVITKLMSGLDETAATKVLSILFEQ